jgi:hypothetical protein
MVLRRARSFLLVTGRAVRSDYQNGTNSIVNKQSARWIPIISTRAGSLFARCLDGGGASGGHTDARVGGWWKTRGARIATRHARAREHAFRGGDVHRGRRCAHTRRISRPLAFSVPWGAAPRPRALADTPRPLPSPVRRSAFPHDHVVTAAAAAGAAGSLGVLAGVYRVRLNRCRCSKAERAEVKQGGPLAMHCRRCLKRTNKGVFVSFLTSPLYVAGAAVGVAHCAHVLGTPMVKGARRARASRR